MSTIMSLLSKRGNIQDYENADKVIYYWGYASRVVPCANDAVTCEYLDFVYSSHITSVLYSFIMWYSIGGVLILLILIRVAKPKSRRQFQLSEMAVDAAAAKESLIYRARRGIQASFRKRLLPEGLVRWFGHVTRLQLLVLAILTGYLTIFRYSQLSPSSEIQLTDIVLVSLESLTHNGSHQ
jgi:ferric-chelate reductase